MSLSGLKKEIQAAGLIRERVYQHLSKEICHGRLAAGQRILESRLSEEIGTSRTPVREAFHLLERDGLLESIPRVGYRVKSISWAEVEEIVQIRFVNESLALRWALKRMGQDEISALEENIVQAERAIQAGRPQSMVEFDAEFHEIMVRASGSVRLVDLCQTLRRHMLRYRIGSISHPEVSLRAVEGHKRILTRIKDKDYQGAKKALHEHLEITKKDIRKTKFRESEG